VAGVRDGARGGRANGFHGVRPACSVYARTIAYNGIEIFGNHLIEPDAFPSAILNCQGWTRSDGQWVVVRLEPLQQPARRAAQEQLCRKLTGLGAKIPGGRWLRIKVGDAPL